VLDVLTSLGEFCVKVAHRWYAFGVGVIGGILGLASSLYAQAHPKTAPLIPTWIWLTSLAGGIFVAIIWAFHDVRRERDAAKDEVKRRSDAMRNALRLDGVSLKGRPGPAGTVDAQLQLQLKNTSDKSMRFEIEDVSTSIEGKPGEGGFSGASATVIQPHEPTTVVCSPVRGLPPGWQGGGLLKLTVRYGAEPSPDDASSPAQYRVRWEYTLRFSRSAPQEQDIEVSMNPVRNIVVQDI